MEHQPDSVLDECREHIRHVLTNLLCNQMQTSHPQINGKLTVTTPEGVFHLAFTDSLSTADHRPLSPDASNESDRAASTASADSYQCLGKTDSDRHPSVHSPNRRKRPDPHRFGASVDFCSTPLMPPLSPASTDMVLDLSMAKSAENSPNKTNSSIVCESPQPHQFTFPSLVATNPFLSQSFGISSLPNMFSMFAATLGSQIHPAVPPTLSPKPKLAEKQIGGVQLKRTRGARRGGPRRNHSVRRFRCNQCSEVYPSLNLLYQHTVETHGTYRCHVCNGEFTQRSNLQRHALKHVGFKPFVCRICGKAYTRKDHLMRHMETHPGLNPRENIEVHLTSSESLDYLKSHNDQGRSPAMSPLAPIVDEESLADMMDDEPLVVCDPSELDN